MKLSCGINTIVAIISITTAPSFTSAGNVFSMTNAKSGNEVLMYNRDENDGTISFVDSYSTGGLGGTAQSSPDNPIGSQGSLVASENGRCLYVVNPGSNTISAFRIHSDSLTFRGQYDTNGEFPVSIALGPSPYLYVLNAGKNGSISGFEANWFGNCKLTPLGGSTRTLKQKGQTPPSYITSPSQVSFTPDGDKLVVVAKGVNEGFIWVFGMHPDGNIDRGTVSIAEGFTPFGFDFDTHSNLLIAEAYGTANSAPVIGGLTENAGAVSSYEINDDNSLSVNDASEPNQQTATSCLKYYDVCAYATNNVSNTISSYLVFGGQLTLVHEEAATLNAPVDLFIHEDGYLYALSTGHTLDENDSDHGQPAIYVYAINSFCTIEHIQTYDTGLPHEDESIFGAVGMVAL